MSRDNSDKEFYYALYHKFNPGRLESILNVKLSEIELDKNFNGRKIDLYSATEDGRELFMELQLNQSDNVHLEQILKIVENEDINNILLVWGAIEFRDDMLKIVEEKINKSGRNICFTALRLNEKITDYLSILNDTFITKVVDKLNILDGVENHFTIKAIYYRLQNEDKPVCCKKQDEDIDLSKKEYVIKYLLSQLRRQVWYYPSLHRDKNLTNHIIVLAGGKSDINYFIGLNRKNMLYVEIKFGEKRKDIFELLLQDKEKVYDRLDYMAEFDVENRKIGTYIYYSSNKREMLTKQISRVADKYIRFFCEYTFPNKLNDEV